MRRGLLMAACLALSWATPAAAAPWGARLAKDASSDKADKADKPSDTGKEKEKPDASAQQRAKVRHDPAGLREARGKVSGVDKDKNVVVVNESSATLPLKVDKSTTIFIDGRTGTMDEISEGQEVRASYENLDGANRAQWLEVSKKPRKPAQTKEQLPEAPSSTPAAPGGTPLPH